MKRSKFSAQERDAPQPAVGKFPYKHRTCAEWLFDELPSDNARCRMPKHAEMVASDLSRRSAAEMGSRRLLEAMLRMAA